MASSSHKNPDVVSYKDLKIGDFIQNLHSKAKAPYGIVAHIGPLAGKGNNTSVWAVWTNKITYAKTLYMALNKENFKPRPEGVLGQWMGGENMYIILEHDVQKTDAPVPSKQEYLGLIAQAGEKFVKLVVDDIHKNIKNLSFSKNFYGVFTKQPWIVGYELQGKGVEVMQTLKKMNIKPLEHYEDPYQSWQIFTFTVPNERMKAQGIYTASGMTGIDLFLIPGRAVMAYRMQGLQYYTNFVSSVDTKSKRSWSEQMEDWVAIHHDLFVWDPGTEPTPPPMQETPEKKEEEKPEEKEEEKGEPEEGEEEEGEEGEPEKEGEEGEPGEEEGEEEAEGEGEGEGAEKGEGEEGEEAEDEEEGEEGDEAEDEEGEPGEEEGEEGEPGEEKEGEPGEEEGEPEEGEGKPSPPGIPEEEEEPPEEPEEEGEPEDEGEPSEEEEGEEAEVEAEGEAAEGEEVPEGEEVFGEQEEGEAVDRPTMVKEEAHEKPAPKGDVAHTQILPGDLVHDTMADRFAVVHHIGPLNQVGDESAVWGIWKESAEKAEAAYATAPAESMKAYKSGYFIFHTGDGNIYKVVKRGIPVKNPMGPENASEAFRDMFLQYKGRVSDKDVKIALKSWPRFYGKGNVQRAWKELKEDGFVVQKGKIWEWSMMLEAEKIPVVNPVYDPRTCFWCGEKIPKNKKGELIGWASPALDTLKTQRNFCSKEHGEEFKKQTERDVKTGQYKSLPYRGRAPKMNPNIPKRVRLFRGVNEAELKIVKETGIVKPHSGEGVSFWTLDIEQARRYADAGVVYIDLDIDIERTRVRGGHPLRFKEPHYFSIKWHDDHYTSKKPIPGVKVLEQYGTKNPGDRENAAKKAVERFTWMPARRVKTVSMPALDQPVKRISSFKTLMYESNKRLDNPRGNVKLYYHPWEDGHERCVSITEDGKYIIARGRAVVKKEGIDDLPPGVRYKKVKMSEVRAVPVWGRLATLIRVDLPCVKKDGGTLRYIPKEGWRCDVCGGRVSLYKMKRGMILYDEKSRIVLCISKVS